MSVGSGINQMINNNDFPIATAYTIEHKQAYYVSALSDGRTSIGLTCFGMYHTAYYFPYVGNVKVTTVTCISIDNCKSICVLHSLLIIKN